MADGSRTPPRWSRNADGSRLAEGTRASLARTPCLPLSHLTSCYPRSITSLTVKRVFTPLFGGLSCTTPVQCPERCIPMIIRHFTAKNDFSEKSYSVLSRAIVFSVWPNPRANRAKSREICASRERPSRPARARTASGAGVSSSSSLSRAFSVAIATANWLSLKSCAL